MQDFKEIPSAETIQEAAKLEIFDEDGHTLKFGTLFSEQKTIVVFIRHFICGVSYAMHLEPKPIPTFNDITCQSYVIQLAGIPTAALEAAGVKLVIIGCGESGPIKAYKEITNYTGHIYADPTRKLYHALGMTLETQKVTEAGETKASYVPSSRFVNTISSIGRALQRPSMIGKQGNFSQIGGEFIFGPGNVCTFASRMRHTEDHIEVADLMKEAGVVYP